MKRDLTKELKKRKVYLLKSTLKLKTKLFKEGSHGLVYRKGLGEDSVKFESLESVL